jgi:hypothetical protein
MSSVEAVEQRLSFEDILEAVQESKRGRWFLKEFENRFQKQDTGSILQAISKLEARMNDLGPQADQPDELSKVKFAIANARNDLLKLGAGKEALSAEGQMFANLAELARKAIPANVEANATIVRTLQLVAEIDRTISPPSKPDSGAKYFNADEQLFERDNKIAKPVLVASTPVTLIPASPPVEKTIVSRKEEPVATGAKLIIRRTSGSEAIEADAAASLPVTTVAEVVSTPLAAPPVVSHSEDVAKIDTPRIVIIRRRAEEMANVETDSVSAA